MIDWLIDWLIVRFLIYFFVIGGQNKKVDFDGTYFAAKLLPRFLESPYLLCICFWSFPFLLFVRYRPEFISLQKQQQQKQKTPPMTGNQPSDENKKGESSLNQIKLQLCMWNHELQSTETEHYGLIDWALRLIDWLVDEINNILI